MVAGPPSEVLKLFNASVSQWTDWRWQLRNSIRDLHALRAMLTAILRASPADLGFDLADSNPLEIKITPHVVANICEVAERHGVASVRPLLATYAPTGSEEALSTDHSALDDGRGELAQDVNPVRSIINFFHNRVLLMVESMCPAYCRYCFRRSVIGDGIGFYNRRFVAEGLDYVRHHPEISEVILSGGDPMVLADGPLSEILDGLRQIAHIRVIRIDTKALTSLPQRFDGELCRLLARHKPVFVMGNFLHAGELSDETVAACERLIDHGVPLFSHTALLRGINDDSEVLQDLFEGLIAARVKPYYLIHFIPTRWTEHFRVTIEDGLRLYDQLHARVSGLALPVYIIYLPEGRGKVPILPHFLIRREGPKYYFRNFEGHEVCYVDGPAASPDGGSTHD